MKNSKPRIFISTYPFGKANHHPVDLLESTGWELIYNPFGRRLKTGEIENFIKDVDVVIAGTEPYPVEILEKTNIKAICRVGIGLDNVPLEYCHKKGIKVSYTPDAPSQAVAELTMANILNLSRHIIDSDHSVREGAWNRYMGVLIEEIKIGIVGIGRIGKRVAALLQPFNPQILACDLDPDVEFGRKYNLTWMEKNDLLQHSDIITVHIPYNKMNHHFINRKALSLMKTGSSIINSSRGAIIDEKALFDALIQRHISGAALDVFEKEPYEGPLTQLDNVILTAHMGASARKSRYLMELGAAEDCIRILNDQKIRNDAILDNLSI